VKPLEKSLKKSVQRRPPKPIRIGDKGYKREGGDMHGAVWWMGLDQEVGLLEGFAILDEIFWMKGDGCDHSGLKSKIRGGCMWTDSHLEVSKFLMCFTNAFEPIAPFKEWYLLPPPKPPPFLPSNLGVYSTYVSKQNIWVEIGRALCLSHLWFGL
jgi:hypothetical protein